MNGDPDRRFAARRGTSKAVFSPSPSVSVREKGPGDEGQNALKSIDQQHLEHWPHHGFAVSAPDDHFDCVSRYSAPGAGIPEDPVTGSIHSALVPYWSQVLGKNTIHAYQASARGGELHCEYHPDRERVTIRGEAALYMQGTISLTDLYS